MSAQAQARDVVGLERPPNSQWPSIVLTCVFAESCMSAGPKTAQTERGARERGACGVRAGRRGLSGAIARVAPVSRPETVMITLCIRCSMKGRATMMRTSLSSEL